MNKDQYDKSTNMPTTKNNDFNVFKRCSFFPDFQIINKNDKDDDNDINDDDEYFPERKRFIERTNRSKSHYHYTCRPEFVPRPKPKPTKVKPSPMKLKSKFALCNNESDHCLSPLESEEENFIEDIDTNNDDNKNELGLNDLRRTLTKIKVSPLKKQAKDSNQLLRNSTLMNAGKRRSVFTKTIKGFIEDEKETNKQLLTMSIGPIDTQPKHISILNVLEKTAENKSLELVKCKSTII